MSALLGQMGLRGRKGLDAGSPDDLLPCPNCSLRSLPLDGRCRPQFTNGRHSGALMLLPCCALSKEGQPFAGWPRDNGGRRVELTPAEENSWRYTSRILIANWWRVRRLTGNPEKLQWLRDHRGITPAMEELA